MAELVETALFRLAKEPLLTALLDSRVYHLFYLGHIDQMIAGLVIANPVIERQHRHLVQHAVLLLRVKLAEGYQLLVRKHRDFNGAREFGSQALAADEKLPDLFLFVLQDDRCV